MLSYISTLTTMAILLFFYRHPKPSITHVPHYSIVSKEIFFSASYTLTSGQYVLLLTLVSVNIFYSLYKIFYISIFLLRC